jgi:heme/copper-type cytochrome/quinol oxidase subunit 2
MAAKSFINRNYNNSIQFNSLFTYVLSSTAGGQLQSQHGIWKQTIIQQIIIIIIIIIIRSIVFFFYFLVDQESTAQLEAKQRMRAKNYTKNNELKFTWTLRVLWNILMLIYTSNSYYYTLHNWLRSESLFSVHSLIHSNSAAHCT